MEIPSHVRYSAQFYKLALGWAIADLRREMEKKQQTLADDAALSRGQLSRIEGGGENPTLESLLAIADGLGVNLSELCRRAEELLGESASHQARLG